MSENIFPTSFKNAEDALKTASQIRRTCLILNENTGSWRILISNIISKLQEDIHTLDLSESASFININDSQGNIQRQKVQLNTDNTYYFTELISSFNSKDNLLTRDFTDLPRRFKALITKPKEEIKEEPVEVDRSGTHELKPYEYICYFKKSLPLKTIITQKLDIDSYEYFSINLIFNDKKSIDCISPLIRKGKLNLKEILQAINQGKKVDITLELKEKVLERLKYIMFNNDLEQLMNMRSPLNKPVFTDLSNYIIKDIKII